MAMQEARLHRPRYLAWSERDRIATTPKKSMVTRNQQCLRKQQSLIDDISSGLDFFSRQLIPSGGYDGDKEHEERVDINGYHIEFCISLLPSRTKVFL